MTCWCNECQKKREKGEELQHRVSEWMDFACLVGKHIEEYTIPQYGDYPNDQMTEASIEDILHNIKRYANRIPNDSRGIDNSLLDCLKIAHYAGIMYNKIMAKKEVMQQLGIRKKGEK